MSRRRHSQGTRPHTHHIITQCEQTSSGLPIRHIHTHTHTAGYRSQNHSPLINQAHPPDPVAKSSLTISQIFTPLRVFSCSAKMRFSPLLSWRRICQMRRGGRKILVRTLLMETCGFQSCWPFLTYQCVMDSPLERSQDFLSPHSETLILFLLLLL